MVKQFLKMAGVKTQDEFYKKYPSEEAFFKAHPEAMDLVHQKMTYGGGLYAYAPGGPILPGTLSKAIADYKQAQAQPSVGADGMTDFIRRPQDAAPAAAAPTGGGQHFALNPYQGVSVYDFLEAQHKAGDYNSRKGLAKTLGISGYTGTPGQNAQMMEMIRQNPDVLLNYIGAPAPVRKSKPAANGNGLSGYSDEEIAAAKKANPGLFETDQERQARQNHFVIAPGQPSVDTPKGLKDYLPQLGRGTSEKDRRIIERQEAEDMAAGRTDMFTLPNGKRKKYSDMTWNEKRYVEGKSLEGKGRINENDEAWYDKVNPLAWITGAAGALGEAPLKAEMSGSIKPIVSAVAAPVAAGAGAGYLNYFRPRYEPYTPPRKELPPAGPIAGQRALPPSQRALPPSTPRGWTMGEGAYRSPNFPFHRDGGENEYSGTYSNGVYFQGGGSYYPTNANPNAPLPKFMYGMKGGGESWNTYAGGGSSNGPGDGLQTRAASDNTRTTLKENVDKMNDVRNSRQMRTEYATGFKPRYRNMKSYTGNDLDIPSMGDSLYYKSDFERAPHLYNTPHVGNMYDYPFANELDYHNFLSNHTYFDLMNSNPGAANLGWNEGQALDDWKDQFNTKYYDANGNIKKEYSKLPRIMNIPKRIPKESFGGPAFSDVTLYPHQAYVPAYDWMAEGGLVKGSIHDVSEDDIQHLINQGYKIEYL